MNADEHAQADFELALYLVAAARDCLDEPLLYGPFRMVEGVSKLLARVEAGEEVEIARDGVPVARLVRVEPSTPGSRFLAARGKLAGSITVADDFEFSDAEIDDLLGDPE